MIIFEKCSFCIDGICHKQDIRCEYRNRLTKTCDAHIQTILNNI